jgi:hypothetical protein
MIDNIVGTQRTTPLFREVPVEVKGGGFGAAGEGEGLLEKAQRVDHGLVSLLWAVCRWGKKR